MRRHHSVAEQRTHVEAWRASGLSARAFAARIGISHSSFARWVWRFPAAGAEPAASTPAPPSVPAPPPPPPKATPAPVAPAPSNFVQLAEPIEPFAVVIGDVPLRFGRPPPAAWFAAVVRELDRC